MQEELDAGHARVAAEMQRVKRLEADYKSDAAFAHARWKKATAERDAAAAQRDELSQKAKALEVQLNQLQRENTEIRVCAGWTGRHHRVSCDPIAFV